MKRIIEEPNFKSAHIDGKIQETGSGLDRTSLESRFREMKMLLV